MPASGARELTDQPFGLNLIIGEADERTGKPC
jgi:hypothetical protein